MFIYFNCVYSKYEVIFTLSSLDVKVTSAIVEVLTLSILLAIPLLQNEKGQSPGNSSITKHKNTYVFFVFLFTNNT